MSSFLLLLSFISKDVYSGYMPESDEVLIEYYLEGTTSALKTLIERYTDMLYNYVKRIGGGEMAEDIVQDIFITVWKQLSHFDKTKASFKTWLFRIARNKTIDTLRKKRSIVFSDMAIDAETDSLEESIADTAPLPDILIQRTLDTQLLQGVLDTLPENYKTVIVLHYENGMTFEEIGISMKTPANTVKSWHRRAILTLRARLHQTLSE